MRSSATSAVVALATATLTVHGACGGPKGSCDPKGIAAALDALAVADLRHRSPLAAAAIAEACATASPPMPAGLHQALADHASSGGEGGFGALGHGLAESLAEAPHLWERACQHSVRDIVDGLGRFAREGQGSFTTFCDARRAGFTTDAEIARADPGLLLLATLTHAWLATEGTTPANARRLARALFIDRPSSR